jgi:hypothetical protein
MSVRDILPVPMGRLWGSTIIPSMEARPLLVNPDTVDITLCVGSFYEIRVTGPSNYVGVYHVPLQPARPASAVTSVCLWLTSAPPPLVFSIRSTLLAPATA